MHIARGSARAPRQLSTSLLHHLDLYTLAAAGVAGVGLLALSQPAEAKIVYTKTHQIIGYNGIYDLDLTHDGIVDFTVRQRYSAGTTTLYFQRSLLAKGALGNAVAGGGVSAYALKARAEVGPHQRFISAPNSGVMVAAKVFSPTNTWGKWINVNNRYLGLEFKIKGKTHYGWARLSVHNSGDSITAVLTGYAYETVASRPIRAGQTKQGGDAIQSNRPNAAAPYSAPLRRATLGELALGAPGVPSRRQP